jgi:hypothetical protein
MPAHELHRRSHLPQRVKHQDAGQRGRAGGDCPPASLNSAQRHTIVLSDDHAAMPTPPAQPGEHNDGEHFSHDDQDTATQPHPQLLS